MDDAENIAEDTYQKYKDEPDKRSSGSAA